MEFINKKIKGYRLLKFIGSGSFGSVYKAIKGDQYYAIKIFREDYVLAEFRKNKDNRITREINVMQNIKHPGLVKYIEHFFIKSLDVLNVFLVMEYIDGKTLKDCIRSEGVENTEDIFNEICLGVKALHDGNVIHRDLKPENIMVQSNGNIKILDYGLAKLIDYTSITCTGDILGTYAYMSPEQITDSKHLDHRSDLYSLGMILYEMYTTHLPFEAQTVPEFIDKIKNELPLPPRKWKKIPNKKENTVLRLLEKMPYKRHANINELIEDYNEKHLTASHEYNVSPRFILRTYNEKSVLEQFLKDHPKINISVNYPVNHQFQQKGLLKICERSEVTSLFDPATIRFAYDTYSDVKGLVQLNYCPANYEVITPSYLAAYRKQKEYVRQVIDEQIKLNADILTSPYHYSHNTNTIPTSRRNPVAEWFDLDVKLLQEALDYRNSNDLLHKKPLYAGIAINALSLSDIEYKNELLNTYAAINCDGFIVYADGIDKNTTEVTLYHYAMTLLKLQKYTGKPVIAGRLDTLGLGLMCAGITGFTSGAARFESFYEDLYKAATEAYNMYERYYFPDLLGTVAILRKDPVRLQQIITGLGGICSCRYCNGKQVPDLIKAPNTKLHFLELIHDELNKIVSLDEEKRLEYFLKRISKAISNYKKLKAVFKLSDYAHLERWLKVFSKIKDNYVSI